MKHSKRLWMMAAILISGVGFVGCGNKDAKKQVKEEPVQVEQVVSDAELCNVAVNDYLVNVIGKNYAERSEEHTISSSTMICLRPSRSMPPSAFIACW